MVWSIQIETDSYPVKLNISFSGSFGPKLAQMIGSHPTENRTAAEMASQRIEKNREDEK